MSAKLKDPTSGNNLIPKKEIDRYKDLITKKIKDGGAKKAAQIIEELIKSTPKKK